MTIDRYFAARRSFGSSWPSTPVIDHDPALRVRQKPRRSSIALTGQRFV